MDTIELSTHRLHYRIDGDAPDKPWLTFCNSLGTDLHMWDRQVAELSKTHLILRYDRRGHGLSTTPTPPYQLADLGQDVLTLLDRLQIERTDFCGLSIGGLTAQWLGINASERLGKLVVCASAARIGTQESWSARAEAVQQSGLSSLRDATADRWFSPGFREDDPQTVETVLDMLTSTSLDGYIGCCTALGQADLREELPRIAKPLLAISGIADAVCPPTDLEFIASSVHNGRHVALPGRHIVNVEAAVEFNRVLAEFLNS
jgi:3-oxoadipate enol-lactonase